MIVNLPYKSEEPTPRSDALADFHIRVDGLVNYTAESLLLLDMAYETGFNTGLIEPRLPSYLNERPTCPSIRSTKRKWDAHRSRIPQQLFYSAITRLASHFKTYLMALANEIYYSNEEELLAIDQRQLSTRQIYELGSFNRIRQYLKRKGMVQKPGELD